MKFYIFVFLILLSACTYEPAGIVDLNAKEFHELITNDEVFVIDTHIPEQLHIEGTDAIIPHNALNENIGMLPKDKKTPIAVYCRSGSMSAEASQTLKEMGYENIYNLVGGRNAYILMYGE